MHVAILDINFVWSSVMIRDANETYWQAYKNMYNVYMCYTKLTIDLSDTMSSTINSKNMKSHKHPEGQSITVQRLVHILQIWKCIIIHVSFWSQHLLISYICICIYNIKRLGL